MCWKMTHETIRFTNEIFIVFQKKKKKKNMKKNESNSMYLK